MTGRNEPVASLADGAEAAARRDVAAWRAQPASLPRLALGAFEDAPLGQVLGRRLLLALRVPPRALAPLRRLRRSSVDDVIASYCYWRAVRRHLGSRDAWRRLTRGTTILMYHAIGASGERASRFVVPVDRFERQMRWLARNRTVIGFDELVALRRAHRLPPAGAVVITFDDAFVDVRSLAAPILERLRLPATVFVVTARAGGRWPDHEPPALAGRAVLSWSEVDDLLGRGFGIGSQSRSHPDLRSVPTAERIDETAGSRSDIDRALARRADVFAYPHGKWDDGVLEAVERAGYAAACTVHEGRNGAATADLALRRTEVTGTLSLLRFVVAVELGAPDALARVAGALARRTSA